MSRLLSILENSRIQILAIAKIIYSIEGGNLLLLDLRGCEKAPSSYLLIAEALTHVQRMAIVEKIIIEMKRDHGLITLSTDFKAHYQWLLIDFGDIMVHIFAPEARKFYALETLWSGYPAYSLNANDLSMF